jgi:prevent-host-death family protein
MRSVGIRELRNRLGEYVRLAAAGEVVVVTDRDRPVARLGPATEADRVPADHPLAELIRRGLATPAQLPKGVRPRGVGLVRHEQLMEDLARDREDRL